MVWKRSYSLLFLEQSVRLRASVVDARSPFPCLFFFVRFRYVRNVFALFCLPKSIAHRLRPDFLAIYDSFRLNYVKYDQFVTIHIYNQIIPKQKYI